MSSRRCCVGRSYRMSLSSSRNGRSLAWRCTFRRWKAWARDQSGVCMMWHRLQTTSSSPKVCLQTGGSWAWSPTSTSSLARDPTGVQVDKRYLANISLAEVSMDISSQMMTSACSSRRRCRLLGGRDCSGTPGRSIMTESMVSVPNPRRRWMAAAVVATTSTFRPISMS